MEAIQRGLAGFALAKAACPRNPANPLISIPLLSLRSISFYRRTAGNGVIRHRAHRDLAEITEEKKEGVFIRLLFVLKIYKR